MKNIDIIELKNIKFINSEEKQSYGNVAADIYINGVCNTNRGYCDLSTFFADSHLVEGKYHFAPESKYTYKKPRKNLMSYYLDPDENINFSLTDAQICTLSKNSYFRTKRKNKLIKKNKKKLILNKNYLLDRIERNNYFLHYKKHSHYYLDTCDCGNPGCAGIWNGVMINRKGKNIIYSVADIKKDGYTEGILRSGKYKLVISLENLKEIRDQLKPFFNLKK